MNKNRLKFISVIAAAILFTGCSGPDKSSYSETSYSEKNKTNTTNPVTSDIASENTNTTRRRKILQSGLRTAAERENGFDRRNGK